LALIERKENKRRQPCECEPYVPSERRRKKKKEGLHLENAIKKKKKSAWVQCVGGEREERRDRVGVEERGKMTSPCPAYEKASQPKRRKKLGQLDHG